MIIEEVTKEVNLEGKSVCVAIPAYAGVVQADMVGELLKASQWFAAQKCNWKYFALKGCSLVTKARNDIVREFMSGPGEALIMIDDDIIFKAEDLERLVWWLIAGKDVVAGFYRQKQDKIEYRADLVNRNDKPVMGEGGRLIELERVGTGFMGIRREVLEVLITTNPLLRYTGKGDLTTYALFDTKLVNGQYIGEDYAFCDLVRAHGFKVWGDPYCELTHVGRYEFKGSLSDGFTQNAVDSERREEAHEGSNLREAA